MGGAGGCPRRGARGPGRGAATLRHGTGGGPERARAGGRAQARRAGARCGWVRTQGPEGKHRQLLRDGRRSSPCTAGRRPAPCSTCGTAATCRLRSLRPTRRRGERMRTTGAWRVGKALPRRGAVQGVVSLCLAYLTRCPWERAVERGSSCRPFRRTARSCRSSPTMAAPAVRGQGSKRGKGGPRGGAVRLQSGPRLTGRGGLCATCAAASGWNCCEWGACGRRTAPAWCSGRGLPGSARTWE